MNICFFGSSLVSSYWNGAATYYRGILKEIAALGHTITFYEPNAFQRQAHREREMRDENRQHLTRDRDPAQLDELAHVFPAGIRRGSGGALAGEGEKRAVHQSALSRERSTGTTPTTHSTARPNQVSA